MLLVSLGKAAMMNEPNEITREWIAQASDDELVWQIWLYIVGRVEERGWDYEHEVLASLPKGLQAFYDAYDRSQPEEFIQP